jgi:hypothetical protein
VCELALLLLFVICHTTVALLAAVIAAVVEAVLLAAIAAEVRLGLHIHCSPLQSPLKLKLSCSYPHH